LHIILGWSITFKRFIVTEKNNKLHQTFTKLFLCQLDSHNIRLFLSTRFLLKLYCIQEQCFTPIITKKKFKIKILKTSVVSTLSKIMKKNPNYSSTIYLRKSFWATVHGWGSLRIVLVKDMSASNVTLVLYSFWKHEVSLINWLEINLKLLCIFWQPGFKGCLRCLNDVFSWFPCNVVCYNSYPRKLYVLQLVYFLLLNLNNLVMGPGQIFWSRSGHFFCCSGWVWSATTGSGKFPQKSQFFKFFCFRSKKSGVRSKNARVKVRCAPYLLRLRSMLRSGQGPSLE